MPLSAVGVLVQLCAAQGGRMRLAVANTRPSLATWVPTFYSRAVSDRNQARLLDGRAGSGESWETELTR